MAKAPDAAAPQPEPDLSGQTVGKYAVGTRLGEGGMGVVYEATDTVLQRKVAFKVVSRKLAADGKARNRLLREARSLAAVNHPGIAAVYEVAEADGQLFIAMERVAGHTLRAHLAQRGGSLEPEEARRIVIDIARALAHAHQAGVVHRDLKPENVMLTPAGEVKILDFGLAKARAPEAGSGEQLATETIEGHVVGTPSYMSPEQAKGQRLDGRSDLFALGSILYELVTGRRAFSGPSVLEVLAAVDRDPPTPPRKLKPELSVELESNILRCLEKSPDARFADASQLVAALEARTAARRQSSARRKVAIAAALLALAGAAVFALRPAPSPLAASEAVLACPPLRARGAPEPNGWLGAAAASLVCQRAGTARWTQARYAILPPAALLGLPAAPTDALPDDVYAAPDAREKAVTAAKREAAAWLDGEVAWSAEGFRVALELKTPQGEVFARGTGSARAFPDAVRLAMEPLWGERGLAMASALPADQAFLRGTADPRAALALFDADFALENDNGWEDALTRLAPHRAAIDPEAWKLVELERDQLLEAPFTGKVALDTSSLPRAMRTAQLGIFAPEFDTAAAADALKALGKRDDPPVLRRHAANLEARLRFAASQQEAGSTLVLATIAEHGTSEELLAMAAGSLGRPAMLGVVRTLAAWHPESGHAWDLYGVPFTPSGRPLPELPVALVERAVLLAPESLVFVQSLGNMYLYLQRLDEARMLGARLLAGPPRLHVAGEGVLLVVEVGEARLKAGLERCKRVLATRERVGSTVSGDEQLLSYGLELAHILGESEAFARFVYETMVKPDPPRLAPGPFAVMGAAAACALGAKEIAVPCTERLDALVQRNYFRDLNTTQRATFEGLTRLAHGDPKGATEAFRRGSLERPLYRAWVAAAFDAAGDPATASLLEIAWINRRGKFNGVNMAYVREARRASARGDLARAKELAQKVIDAWSVADARVPAVDEMRALLRKK